MTKHTNGFPGITTGLLVAYSLLTFYSVMSLLAPLPRGAFMPPLLTVLAFAFAFLHAGQRLGWRSAAILLALCFGISLAFESVGVATGLVYGPYHYTGLLGPKFLGLVPYLIPLAWFMMMYPSMVMVESLFHDFEPGKGGWLSILRVAAVGGLVMTAWDLVMDPMMVKIGYWVWDGPASTRLYFGIPLQNYWGWWLTSFVVFAVFVGTARLIRSEIGFRQASQDRVFDQLALYSYMMTGFGCVFTALLIGLDGPAVVGLIGMGVWAILAWRALGAQVLKPAVLFP